MTDEDALERGEITDYEFTRAVYNMLKRPKGLQPIDTAPKDKEFLVWDDRQGFLIAFWCPKDHLGRARWMIKFPLNIDGVEDVRIDGWLPLPEHFYE